MQLRYSSLWVLAVVSLIMHGCKFVQSKSSAAFENIREQTETYQTYDQCTDFSVLESAKQAFYYIPDHAKVSENAENHMTKDLYDALVAAWDVPCWCDGEIGNEEFLGYFVIGNEGPTVGEAVYVETISV